MSRRVGFSPEAEAEALETRHWYQGRRPGLGAEFRAALDETIERIADNPTQFRLVRGETRRAISPDAGAADVETLVSSREKPQPDRKSRTRRLEFVRKSS